MRGDSGTDSGSGAGTDGGPWPVGDPGSEGDGRITVTNMTRQPELSSQGNPVGKEFTFKLTSQIYQFTEPHHRRGFAPRTNLGTFGSTCPRNTKTEPRPP